MIRIVLVDDQPIVCEGLRVILDARPNMKVVGVAHDGIQSLNVIEETTPDVVLMDLKMPVMNGVQATRAIREKFPDVVVVILTTYDEDEWVVDAIRAGAKGYLLKGTDGDDIAAAIEGAIAGRTPVAPQIAEKLFTFIQYGLPQQDSTITDSLTDRERDVLRLIASGLTNAAIADRLHLARALSVIM